MTTDQATASTTQRPPPTWLEWSARLVSLVLVLALLSFIAVNGMQSTEPPVFEHTIDPARIEQRDGSWVVPMRVRNAGTVSVSNLGVTLRVTSGDDPDVESEAINVGLLGRGAEKEVVFWLDDDPTAHDLHLDVDGYLVP